MLKCNDAYAKCEGLTSVRTAAFSVRPQVVMFLARESLATAGSISIKVHCSQPLERASSPTAPVNIYSKNKCKLVTRI